MFEKALLGMYTYKNCVLEEFRLWIAADNI